MPDKKTPFNRAAHDREHKGALPPSGSMLLYGGATAPDGWLLCDGTAVSRQQYSRLFAILGTTYGTGDGSTTFNLPDLRGRFPVGDGTFAALGGSDGFAEANRNPATHGTAVNTTAGGASNRLTGVSINDGDTHSYLVVNFIIKF